ncbi:hypothetical protein PHYPSEUDO_008552 [Phytophthora pseudosyringae]|uniref:PDZ domain-containing protein n=1 Tax=Phytophthora pseudosyringae TaxID=221518 RepID=A0A8T1VDQ0_9STRA|nr:hypothetical protein PHYPSEUDO_008552 [Phytophthora pseudosyringae]
MAALPLLGSVMGSRRVFPLSVDASPSSTSVNRSQPPPPKSPVHRTPTGNGAVNDLARPPTGGSVGYVGFDRLMMMRQVNAAAAPPITTHSPSGGDEASAAVNHRQRMAAEQQRRTELAFMAKEDYTGTPEGQARLQRQEEQSRMKEEELLVLRLVEAEKEAARKLQRERELEEEKRVKEQYLAKIRAQREQQEMEAKEKEAARKAEMEHKMKALKEAADAKARAEFAAKQHAIEEEARLVREKHQIEEDNAQMQVEDVLGHAMQQEMVAERERQRQIAAEQEEWRLFQEREQDKQREAAQMRRAAMAQQYEQDKQRRIQIHKLQKERAAEQAKRKELQRRQIQEHQLQKEEPTTESGVDLVSADDSKLATQDDGDSELVALSTGPTDATNDDDVPSQDEPKETSSTQNDHSSAASGASGGGYGDKLVEIVVNSDTDQAEPPEATAPTEPGKQEGQTTLVEPNISAAKSEDEARTEDESIVAGAQDRTNADEQGAQGPRACDIPDVQEKAKDENSENTAQENEGTIREKSDQDENVASIRTNAIEESVADVTPIENEKREEDHPVWSLSAAREQGFVPFAQVLSVTDNSPAMHATLKSGDLLVEFGGIVSSTPKCLMAMAECVQTNVNNSILVVLLRPAETSQDEQFGELRVSLCPRKWKGKGLLGCQLSPFKWTEEKVEPTQPQKTEPAAAMEDPSSSDEGASALVVYDIVPASAADQAGLLNGDILAGCDGLEVSVSVANLSEVVGHIQAQRAACTAVYLALNRWIDEDQCYRSLRVELPAAQGSLGFALTSFAEYYNYYSSTAVADASACEACYYTVLTTALHAAALSGHVSCLEALLNSLQNGDGGGYSASDYLDWRDEDGRTPLFYACYAGQLECVRYLLRTTQSVSDEQQLVASAGVDLYGDTVLHAATTSGDTAVMALLLDSGCVKVDDRNHTHLTCAHIAPNVETLTFLGEQCQADLLATDAEERMPLAYACLHNDVDSIQYLCKKHPDFVDYADVRGNTPLHVAAWLGLQGAAEVLITFLPSIALYITNADGQNAAQLARANGMEDIAAFLDSVIAAADTNVS